MNQPANRFQGAPSYRPEPVPPYDPAQHIPPPIDLDLILRLDQKRGRVLLSQALVVHLGLRASQPIDLLPPSNSSPYWHLDLRPEARRRVSWYANTRPRIEGVCRPCKQVQLGPNPPTGSLVLRLLPGEPHFTGFYPMLPYAEPAR